MVPKISKTIPIKESTEKRMITAMFTITLNGHFLPMELIYGGKISKSLPIVNFPKLFLLSVNSKHYSNKQESIKVLEKIIIPYVKKEGTIGNGERFFTYLFQLLDIQGGLNGFVKKLMKRKFTD